jgi:hypothetical protein
MAASNNKKVDLMTKFRDDNPQKFIRYLTKLEKYTGQMRSAFEECEGDNVFACIIMKYIKLMAKTPEMIDIDPDARVLLNDRILFLRRMFEKNGDKAGLAELSGLIKHIVRARGSTPYAEAP